jgi:2,3-bisphosphoglycerate-independent phosphoglycerate mutase
VREHRFALVLRGADLHPGLDDTDPQAEGVPPLPSKAIDRRADRTAKLVSDWTAKASELLRGEKTANGLTLRGFSTDPYRFPEIFGRAGCVAVYPMYAEYLWSE